MGHIVTFRLPHSLYVTVTLYTPDGSPISYDDVAIDMSLVPDLQFTATVDGKRVHIATTLPYLLTAPAKESAPND